MKVSTARKIYAQILDNGGVTLHADNFDIAEIDRGWMVSSSGFPEQRVTLDTDNTGYDLQEALLLAAQAITKARDAVTDANPHIKGSFSTWYVGAWIDGGEIVVDASENIFSQQDAVITGKARNQKAIYNCKTGDVLHLNG